MDQQALYHIARKDIESIQGIVPGIKLESFIFDIFPFANKVALFEVVREEEFAPVKVRPDSLKCLPSFLTAIFRIWLDFLDMFTVVAKTECPWIKTRFSRVSESNAAQAARKMAL